MKGLCDVHGLHRQGVYSRVIHAGRYSAGRGVKVLHLLGLAASFVEVFRQCDGVGKRAARMRGHEVRHDVLLLGKARVHFFVLFHEALIHVDVRLAHIVENAVDAVLGRDLELAGDVIFDKLGEEIVVFILEHVVVAYTAAHENLFYARYLPQPAQQGEIVRVIRVEIRAGRRRKTSSVGAHAAFGLLFARMVAEVCRRTADVVYIALEVGEFCQCRDLAYDAFVAAARDHSALMEGQSTEAAAAEAAAVMDDRKLDLLDCGNAAEGLVHGVILLCVRKLGDAVELLCLKRHCRGIYDKIPPVVLLDERTSAHGVVLGVLKARRVSVKAAAVADVGKRWQRDAIKRAIVRRMRQNRSSAYIAHLGHGYLLFEPTRYLA